MKKLKKQLFLFLELASDESQLNYPIYYAIARDGKAGKTTDLDDDLHVIFDSIINDKIISFQ